MVSKTLTASGLSTIVTSLYKQMISTASGPTHDVTVNLEYAKVPIETLKQPRIHNVQSDAYAALYLFIYYKSVMFDKIILELRYIFFWNTVTSKKRCYNKNFYQHAQISA